MFNRSELKQQAKDLMKKHFPQMFLVCLIWGLVAGDLISIDFSVDTGAIVVTAAQHQYTLAVLTNGWFLMMFMLAIAAGIAFAAFLKSPLRQGVSYYFRNCSLGKAKIEDLLHSFSSNYLHHVKVLFHRDIRIFAWTLLLIVPGIIKEYEYAFVDYILNDQPDITPEDALELSSRMTDGLKWEMFVLDLSFILWALLASVLAVFTLGLSGIALNVYTNQTHAQLYQWVLDRDKTEDGSCEAEAVEIDSAVLEVLKENQ